MLEGKVIIVTGAGSGIGRSVAIQAAKAGGRLVVADRNSAAAEETAGIISTDSGTAIALRCDVTRSDDVAEMVARTTREFGRLDGAFNNAGVAQDVTNTVDCDETVFDRLMAINAKGAWLCLKHEIPAMLAQGGGSIVVNASLAGIRANPGTPAYIASKHAAVALAQGAALEYGNLGVRVNCVCPGMIHSPMTERFVASLPSREAAESIMLPGRWGEIDEVAGAVLWLLSDASSLANGVTLALDGGRTAA